MKKILIVDDHADIRRLIRMTLEFEDYEIVEAADGSAAIDLARQQRPDLVLMDVMMPGPIDGLEACRQLKQGVAGLAPPVILLTAKGTNRDREAGLQAGADAYLVKPFGPLQLIEHRLDLAGRLSQERLNMHPQLAITPAPLPTPAPMESRSFDDAASAQMERIIVDLGRMYHERNEALREVTRAHHEALMRLSIAAELRDDDTGVHIVRMGYLCEALALHLGRDAHYAHMLRLAAPMHDIGKIGVPDLVLKKPGALTPDERIVMNQHPAIGAKLLGRSRIPVFQLAAELALSHHERWDGQGYPLGLVGEQIPLSGRIVAVVDYFDALTMDRCYRKAFSDEEALLMLAGQRGVAFDPDIVDGFIAHAPALIALRDSINANPPSFDALAEHVGETS